MIDFLHAPAAPLSGCGHPPLPPQDEAVSSAPPIATPPPPHDASWRMVVDAWNRTAVPYPRDATVHELFEEVAAEWPDAPALECGGERMTYAELDAELKAGDSPSLALDSLSP